MITVASFYVGLCCQRKKGWFGQGIGMGVRGIEPGRVVRCGFAGMAQAGPPCSFAGAGKGGIVAQRAAS